MAAFLTPLRVQLVDPDAGGGKGEWQLVTPLVYRSSVALEEFIVPVGFVTDFASVLRLPVAYAIFGDTAHAAATLHDYLYRYRVVPRQLADDVFLEAIRSSTAMAGWRSSLMWAAVRLFGRFAWKEEHHGGT